MYDRHFVERAAWSDSGKCYDVANPIKDGHAEGGVKYVSNIIVLNPSPTGVAIQRWSPGYLAGETVKIEAFSQIHWPVKDWGPVAVVCPDDRQLHLFNEIRPTKAS